MQHLVFHPELFVLGPKLLAVGPALLDFLPKLLVACGAIGTWCVPLNACLAGWPLAIALQIKLIHDHLGGL